MDDSKEFEVLYAAHLSAIQRFFFGRTRDAMLTDDLTSDVFIRAWRSRGRFDGRSAGAWLHRIARNRLIDHWRSKTVILTDDPESLAADNTVADSSEVLDRAMAAETVRVAMERLPADMRRVITLRFTQGLSCRDAARELHMSEGNVRVVQYRALRKLKEYLL